MKKSVEIVNELKKWRSDENAAFLQRFFKTAPGEYGERDKFLGIRVPQTRKLAKKFKETKEETIQELLDNEWHEVRLLALLILVDQFKRADERKKTSIFDRYIKNIGSAINNWDLVDITCIHIVGYYLADKDRGVLYDLILKGLWHKRVAIISTFYFLKRSEVVETYNLAEKLLYESHDLMHKAVGWSLREMGKVDLSLLKRFLDSYAATMPRTTLRYSLEKFSQVERSYYMGLKVANSC